MSAEFTSSLNAFADVIGYTETDYKDTPIFCQLSSRYEF